MSRLVVALPFALAFALALPACGHAHAPAPARAPAPTPVPRSAPAPASTAALPTLDDLAARAPLVAPGMREVARREDAASGAPIEIARATSSDRCVRLAFVATAEVTATFDATPSATTAPAREGALPAHGPLCIPRGTTLHATFSASVASPVTVRWIAWGSP